jgi:peptidoglycan hydrolase-like protein with peptidoglycan-binding domain
MPSFSQSFVNHREGKMNSIIHAEESRVLAKRKKPHVKGIVEDRLKPSTLFSCLLVTSLTGMIFYNLFVAQGRGQVERALIPDGATTKVTVAEPGKSSNTVTIRYDELVEDVQQHLLALGHFRGMVDGVNGPMTKEAVINYQRGQQLEETGEVTRALLEHIEYTRKITQAAEFTGSVQAVKIEPEANTKAAAPEEAAPQINAEKPPVAKIDPKILAVQKRLARIGFDPGVRTGKLDDATKSAILTFEMEHGLTMQGTLSKPFLAALKEAEQRTGIAD